MTKSTITINGFWMLDNENLAGETQYILTESDIENEYNEYLEIFDGDMLIDDFKSEWVFVDADDIQTDSNLRDNLEIDIDRNAIFEQAIIDFIQNAINKPLTEAEQEIIDMLKLEPLASNKQIAHALGKSENTVRNQFNSIYAKYEVNSKRGVDARLKLYWVLGWINTDTTP